MYRSVQLTAAALCLVAHVFAADDSATAPVPLMVPAAEDKYAAEATKAEAILARAEGDAAKARKVAAEIRLKAYKAKLVDVTKAGAFDKALGYKARIEQLEKELQGDAARSAKRPPPKDAIKFGGHTYALIKEPATWHIAKQRCEEMGGHLITIETVEEMEFVQELMSKSSEGAYIGATDELTEGKWLWVTGESVPAFVLSQSQIDNHRQIEDALVIESDRRFGDVTASTRRWYLCEWQ